MTSRMNIAKWFKSKDHCVRTGKRTNSINMKICPQEILFVLSVGKRKRLLLSGKRRLSNYCIFTGWQC